LGGEKLKILALALLFFWAGFFVQIPNISAQDVSAPEDPLLAAEQAMTFDESEVQTAPPPGPSIWVVIRMVLVLALAAAAIYGVVFFLKRSAKQTVDIDPFLKILASAHLGSNRYAHVVSVGSKAWLLGSSDGGVNLIGEIEDKDVINAMLLEDSGKSAQASSRFPDFLSMLRRLGVRTDAGTPAERFASGAEEIRKRRERLKGL
jgi:flagellar protein FliO/FliZ